jgi:hypothetical protein
MIFKTDSDEFQVKKSGIAMGAYLGVGVGYWDVAGKTIFIPTPLYATILH